MPSPSLLCSMKNVDNTIKKKIDNLPRLASLRSVNTALGELINAEYSFTSQIAEIIRRDPSLTSRLLKLVNSVFFGLSKRISNIEDAVFYLGLQQIRELALVTPVIEDFGSLNHSDEMVNWRLLWQHSIGSAILTREILSLKGLCYEDDTDYIVGLVHNVGKIVIAFGFSEEFELLVNEKFNCTEDLCKREIEIIGWDHARIGAYYLKNHQLSEEIVEAVEYHNHPGDAPKYSMSSAAIQLADHMVRSVGIGGIEHTLPIDREKLQKLAAWPILFGENEEEHRLEVASLWHTLSRLPAILSGIV